MNTTGLQEQIVTVAVIGRSSSAYSNLIKAMSDMGFGLKKWSGSAEECGTLCDVDGRKLRLVMLPGGRAISPRTKEEGLARDYLVSGKADLILNVADATTLQSDLSLTIRLTEFGIPLVMALSRVDLIETRGSRIDIPALETILNSAVVPIATRKNSGPEELLRRLVFVADNFAACRPWQFGYGDDVECASEFIETAIGLHHPELAKHYPLRWLVYKVMEGDPFVLGKLMPAEGGMIAEALHQLRRVHGEDLTAHLANVRDGLANGVAREVLVKIGATRTGPAERTGRGGLGRFLAASLFLATAWLVSAFGLSASCCG